VVCAPRVVEPANSRSVSTFTKDTKLIYRHFATLFFVVAADGSESELGLLDLVQVFVESLDKAFENVCELDLIFHSDRVHYILDEIIMGGMVLETNAAEIMDAVGAMDKLEHETRSAAFKA
jgi:AP-3 complex subunit sigma